MPLLLLAKGELTREYRKFRLSLRDKKISASYSILSVSILVISTGLYTFLYRISNINNMINLNNFTFSIIEKVLPLVLRSWIVLNIYKISYTNYLARWFDTSDIDLSFCAPIQSNELFISKYIKILFKHILILTIFFIAVIPILIYLNINHNVCILLFITSLLFIEISYFLSISIFFILKSTALNNKFSFKKYNIIITGIFVLFYILLLKYHNISYIDYIYINFPSSITINIYMNLIKNHISIELIINFIKLLIIYLSLIFLTDLFNCNYYEYVFNVSKKSEKKRHYLFMKKQFFSVFIHNFNFLTITQKDFLTYIRENFFELVSYSFINYSFILIFFQRRLYDNFKLIISNNNFLHFFITSFTLIILLTLNTASIESFNRESNKIWILKSSNNRYNNIVKQKVIFSLGINIILNIPIYLLIILSINGVLNRIIMITLIMEIVLIHNLIGTLISATHSKISDRNKRLPLISYFTQMILTMTVSSSSLALVNIRPIYLYTIDIILISLLITKYDKPLLYYIIDITSTIYVISIIAFLSFTVIFLGSLVIRLLVLGNFYLDFSTTMALIVATLLKVAIVTRICLKSTEDAFIENEH